MNSNISNTAKLTADITVEGGDQTPPPPSAETRVSATGATLGGQCSVCGGTLVAHGPHTLLKCSSCDSHFEPGGVHAPVFANAGDQADVHIPYARDWEHEEAAALAAVNGGPGFGAWLSPQAVKMIAAHNGWEFVGESPDHDDCNWEVLRFRRAPVAKSETAPSGVTVEVPA